jgi:hypothetical protein
MAKRKESHDEELPFVALMDTMTNVVGVLIIVLVMMAISLANAVKKVMSDLPPATQEQVDQTRQAIEALRKKIAEETARLTVLEPFRNQGARIASLDQELTRLRDEAAETGRQLVDLQPLTNEVARLDGELDGTMKEVAGEESRRSELKAMIAAIPDAKPLPAREVHMPAAKPIPKNAKIERFIVTSAGIYYVDIEGLKAAFLREFESPAIRDISKKSVRVGNQYRTQYSHRELRDYFAKHPVSWKGFEKVEVLLEDGRGNPGVAATLKPAAFEPSPQFLGFSSNYQRMLRVIRGKPDTIVMFQVLEDGNANYLAARDLSDRSGIAAGWEFGSDIIIRLEIPEIQVDPIVDPNAPPPAPPPPPTPGGTPYIPPPSQKLD